MTYSISSEAKEQNCLFVNVETPRITIKQGKQLARVEGSVVMFAQNENLPFGFFAKAIQAADPADTKDLFFFEVETNTRTYQNLVQRGFSFVYFFSGQYDPDNGTLNAIVFPEE